MNANELMSREPRTVRMGDRLDAAARVLWEHDCGIVPVVDAANVLVGVLTDRDVCMAAYTQGRSLHDMSVGAVMARSVKTCRPEDNVATVLATLQQAQVHRLPVVDARGVLVGMVSTNDLVRAANARPAAVDVHQLVRTLAAIGAPRRAAAPAAKAAAAAVPAKTAAPAPVAAAAAQTPAESKPTTIARAATVPTPSPAEAARNQAGKGKSKPKGRKG